MKKIGILAILFSFNVASSQAQKFQMMGKDTINYVDVAGKKQGPWIIYGKDKEGTCYQPEQKAEEGKYRENRKTGQWVEYYCNGTPKSKVTFLNGRPDGYAITYHENGKVQEEGIWKNNRWVGDYKMFYENGNVQHEFTFNEGGKREGNQKYYHENNELAIEGNFKNGKEAGVIKEYNEDGKLKAEKNFNEGNVDVASIKIYDSKPLAAKTPEKVNTNMPKAIVSKDEKINTTTAAAATVLNGKYTLYNKNKQVSKDGIFKDNRLMDGKAYFYNENGILERVSVYKNGVYVGDTQVEN